MKSISINKQKKVNSNVIAGALYDFMGYITTKHLFLVGATQTPTAFFNHFQDWCKTRSLNYNDPNVSDWEKYI